MSGSEVFCTLSLCYHFDLVPLSYDILYCITYGASVLNVIQSTILVLASALAIQQFTLSAFHSTQSDPSSIYLPGEGQHRESLGQCSASLVTEPDTNPNTSSRGEFGGVGRCERHECSKIPSRAASCATLG